MRHTTKARSDKPSLMFRLTGGRHGHVTEKRIVETTHHSKPVTHHRAGRTHNHHTAGHHTAGHHTAHTTATGHHHRRRPSLGDKVSGAWMKMKGTITRRPGLKAAGTRRERGTDGRGSHRRAYY